MALLTTFYRSSAGLPYSTVFTHFHAWLLSCLNLPSDGSDGAKMDHMTSESSWQHLKSTVDSSILNSVPAMKLFTGSDVGVATNKATPITPTHIASLEAYRETVVYALHLVYEVCRLEKQMLIL